MQITEVPQQILDITKDKDRSELERFAEALPLIKAFLSTTRLNASEIIKVTQTLCNIDGHQDG